MKKFKYITLFTILLTLLFVISGCGTGSVEDTETNIVIFHINDVHGHINNFAKIAAIIQKERETNSNVFVFNGGDDFSGNAIVDQFQPKGEPVVKLIEKIGADVVALGNHDFDYGPERIREVIENAPYPYLCANIKAKEGHQLPKNLEKWTLLKTSSGIKIAVLGLIQRSSYNKIPHTHPDKVKDYLFDDGLEVALKYKHLKTENDIFIALTHLGKDIDEKLAEAMGELDLIIGAHSHTYIKHPTAVNGVSIYQAGGNGNVLGRVDIKYKNGQIIEQKGQLIELKDYPEEDPGTRTMIDEFNNNPALQRVVATLPIQLIGKDSLGNLITDAICDTCGLEIALHNHGGIRILNIGPEVKVKDVYDMLPFGNYVVQLDMTLDELKGLIKSSFENSQKFDMKISGAYYTLKVHKETINGEEKERVDEVIIHDPSGKPLENRTYKVGMNSYIASSYDFQHQDEGQSTGKTVAGSVIEYLEKGTPLSSDIDKLRTFKKQ